MRRRELITLLGGAAAAWPHAVHAQPANIARIGFLGPASASNWADRLEAFRVSLRDLGYVEGQNIVIESRWADEKYNRLPELAAELVDRKVDGIVTYGTPGTLAAMRATKVIPIVMAYSGDALSAGLVTPIKSVIGGDGGLPIRSAGLTRPMSSAPPGQSNDLFHARTWPPKWPTWRRREHPRLVAQKTRGMRRPI